MVDTPDSAQGVAIATIGSKEYAFVADYKSGLQVIDICDPTGPFISGSCDTPDEGEGVAIATIGSGEYAFVADESGLQVIDISDPTRPHIAGSCDTPVWALGVAIATIGSNKYAFVADYKNGLQVIDICDPTGPFIAGSCDTPSYAYEVAIATIGSKEYAFVADSIFGADWGSGLQVIDISDPTEPFIAGSCDTPGRALGVAIAIIDSKEYAFVADGGSGLQVIAISVPTGPFIVASCDTPGSANGVVITTIGSKEYAFVADGIGLQVIDISDPTGPFIAGSCDTPGSANGVAITTIGSKEYAFVADGIGLQVIDISDPTGPFIAGSCDTPGSANGVAITTISSKEYAIVADWLSGLQVINISNPKKPFIAGNCGTPGCADEVDIATIGSKEYAFVADRGSGLQVIDISDPTGPVKAGSCDTPGRAHGVAIATIGSKEYAFVADKHNGLQVIDISDPTGPVKAGSCDTSGWAHRVAIGTIGSKEYAFVADFYSGLQVIDISDPTGPFIAGSCDTPDWAYGVAIATIDSKEYAFVADRGSGLQVIDISDPTGPFIAGSCGTPDWAYGVAIGTISSKEYAFVVDWESGLQVIDISDPTGPFIAGYCDTPGNAYGVAIATIDSKEYAFVVDWGSGLQVIDISDPIGPVIAGSYNTPGGAWEVAIATMGFKEYAVVADGRRGLQVIDISDFTGPFIAGSCYTPGRAHRVAIGTIGSKEYAFVVDWGSGLQVIDISDPTGPVIAGSCDTPDWAKEVAIATIDSKEYAFVADGRSGLQVIDISDPTGPFIAGSCYTPDEAKEVAIATIGSKEYALVANGGNGTQVIDISDPTGPFIAGSCYTPDEAYGVAIATIGSKEYALVANGGSGLQVIDISDPTGPFIGGSCYTPNEAYGVHIATIGSKEYAFVADGGSGLQVIDISDPTGPFIAGSCYTPNEAYGVHIATIGSKEYAFVADGYGGLLKLKINIGPPPEGKGNLILVAGGNINYKLLTYSSHIQPPQPPANSIIRKKGYASNPFDPNESCWNPKASYWQITQAHANHVFNTFQKSGYEVYDIYYFNPEPLQDPDNDGILNQLVSDETDPTSKKLMEVIKKFPEDQFGNHLANNGPLYIYLIGHAAEDRFLITPNEYITAQELKAAINTFQNGYTDNEGTHHPGTNRQVVLIIESAASGTFIDDLKDSNINITVITSTDDGASYIKPDCSDSNSIPYNSFTKAFMDALAPNLDPNNIPGGPPETLNTRINDILKEAFRSARDQFRQWTDEGQPFADQAPQMSLPENTYTSLSFWDGNKPVDHLFIDQNIPQNITIIAEDSFGNTHYLPAYLPDYLSARDILFYPSDPDILDPDDPEDIEIYTDPHGIPWFRITPRKNGRVVLTGHADPDLAPDLLLSAKITIDIYIDDPGFTADPNKIAIIVAGYQGTGDYLWKSTNTIANHAYKTLTDMGYAKDEIYYYNPYILQDVDENERYDDIRGYPLITKLDPNTDSSPLALIKERKIKELLIFLVDHGSIGSFSINPREKLRANKLIEYIKAIYLNVKKVILIYDACNSGSFIDEIEDEIENDSTLSEKLIAITSTDTDQAAYFLNQGIISFSYPFLEEWFLTHSLQDAFEHAIDILPRKGQEPRSTNTDIIWEWDIKNIYYTDESRPAIEEVEYTRGNGRLKITAMVYSLTGIEEVWVIIEGINEPVSNHLGEAITETNKHKLEPSWDPNDRFDVEYTLDIPDPCPNETNYLINLYALDKSRRPKMASYKTAVGTPIESQTLAFIIGNPNLIKNTNDRQKVEKQITRAKEILKRKGLDEGKDEELNDGSIITITESTGLKKLASLIEENKDRNLFIYLIGEGGARNGEPYFSLNPNNITPSTLSYLPYDPNQRLLILMESPYARQFLSAMDKDTLPKNWAGIASTAQERLFFNFEGKHYPFFSNFFFSLVLSGATVSQAYRMAKNAVSLTRQNPEVFLPEKALHYQTINRHLNYYLGTSSIHGEDYSLITECNAKVEEDKIKLSLTAHPDIDTNSTVWAILKSSPSSIGEETKIVDFQPDPNNICRYIPYILDMPLEEIPYNFPYYNALFIVEGRISDQVGKKEWKTEYKEIPIAAPEPEKKEEDEYESDDDPNVILFDPKHEVIINAEPLRHNFYCMGPNKADPNEACHDIDWVWFYAEEGQIYSIYAQDLSEYGYFIQIRLYDSNMELHYDPNTKQYSIANNYLAFYCQGSGYYLLSLYPQGGEEYILTICNLEAWVGSTELILQVKDPLELDLCVKGGEIIDANNTVKYVYYPKIYNFIFDEDLHSWKFDGLPAYKNIVLSIYEGNECNGRLIQNRSVYLTPRNLHEVSIDKLNYLSGIKPIVPPEDPNTIYRKTINGYPLPDKTFPFGDKDPNFPPAGDYDGDGISNLEEVMVYSSYPYFPSITLPLSKGHNLFYLPSINTTPNIISDKKKNIINQVCYYEPSIKAWQKYPWNDMAFNTFNAIDASEPGLLFIDLNKEPTIPVLWLKGFLDPVDSYIGSDPSCCLNTNLFDPNCFKANLTISEILKDPNLPEIEEIIKGQGFMNGKWESSYPFFERFMRQDKRIDPYGVYVIKKSVYH